MKRNYNLSAETLSLYTAYMNKGDRSPEAREATRMYSAAKFADPSNTARAKNNYYHAKRKAIKFGNVVATDPVEIAAMIDVYHEVHQRNLRDGKKIWSVDHTIELHQGGWHTLDNITIMTSRENSIKGNQNKYKSLL